MPSIEQRLAQLEADMKFTKSIVSLQGGQIGALQAAFNGIMTRIGDPMQNIDHEIERVYSYHLANSTNQVWLDGFDGAAEIMREAMGLKANPYPTFND